MTRNWMCMRGFTARILAGLGILLGAATLVLAVVVNVDTDTIFELDGNPQDAVSPTGEDWHHYFNVLNPAPPFPAGNAAAVTFVAETGNVTIFTQGGSKDINGVGQWRHTSGSVPDKDDLQNGYAAAYNVDNNLLVYFGADRTANNGDANIGFWFFQSNVGLNADGTFAGAHQDGDIFVVSGFTSGGQTSEIDVYKWSCPGNPVNCDSIGSLALVTSSTAAQCASSASGSHIACAIANTTSGIPSVWAYTPKSGAAGAFPVASFFEGGINVSALLGSTPCFSSFIVETRSSTSNTAQLKDFLRGNFTLCGMNVTKSCPGNGVVNPGGTSIHYLFNGTVTNSGVGNLSNVTLVDTLPAGTVGTAAFKAGTPAVPPAVPGPANTPVSTVACPAGAPAGAVCANLGSLGGNAVINWSVEFDSTSLSPQNNVIAAGSVSGGSVGSCTTAGTICSDPASAQCTANPSNSITITKTCGVPAGYPNAVLPGTQLVTLSGLAAVQVNFSGDVCNTGQTALTGVTLTDNPVANLTVAWPGSVGSLGVAACAKYSGNYLPSGVTAGDLGGAAGRYGFSDEIKVTGATAALGTSPGHEATCVSGFASDAQACGGRTCNICPSGATCSGN
jgi:hypothetical protein